MARFQSLERVSGEVPNFAPDLVIEIAMSKDKKKRPGAERGEDMFLADKETGLTGVFDGLGAGNEKKPGSGADASVAAAKFAPALYRQLVAEASVSKLSEIAQDQASLEHPDQRMAFRKDLTVEWRQHDPAVQKEIVALYQTVQKLSDLVRQTEGMTTATLGKTVRTADGRRFEVIANVGDSGATLIHADGNAENITREDSVLDYLKSIGRIRPENAADPDYKLGNMTVREMKRAMYQALGNPDLETPTIPRISIRELQSGDSVLYTTDGIRDNLADADDNFDATRAAELLTEGGVEKLMDEAAHGPKKDECTALKKDILAEVEAEESIEEELGAEDVIEETL
jgi:serine/threonine protein phosphatase PrpC